MYRAGPPLFFLDPLDYLKGVSMDVRALYEAIGVNYDDVVRLLRKEERIKLYLVQTMEDPAFADLDGAMARRDYDAAFRAAHTIKGMGMNLMLQPMTEAAIDLVECLRDGVEPAQEAEAAVLHERLKASYDNLSALVRDLA